MTRSLPERLREQADHCASAGSPLTAALLRGAAGELGAPGPVRDLLAPLQDDPAGTVPALRFAGALHRLVLERRAPQLALHYPSVGGTAGADGAWDAARVTVAQQADRLAELVRRPVQTNEVGRSAVLFGGLLVVAHRTGLPMRLLEVGASAGLNLRVDAFAYELGDGPDNAQGNAPDNAPDHAPDRGAPSGTHREGVHDDGKGAAGGTADICGGRGRGGGRGGAKRAQRDGLVLGDASSPVRLVQPWRGRPDAPVATRVQVVQRRGCDPAPVDPGTTEGRLLLTSYVWADQVHRLERLRAALDVAARLPAVVTAEPASAMLARELAEPAPGVATVVWHSVVRQYMDPGERRRVTELLERAGGRARPDAPLVHLALEPEQVPGRGLVFRLRLRSWPGGAAEHLADAQGHGPPVVWGAPDPV